MKLLDPVVGTVFTVHSFRNSHFLQLKEIILVNTSVMWRKLLIINLLLVLALQPVAHAIGPIVGPVEPGQTLHELMNME